MEMKITNPNLGNRGKKNQSESAPVPQLKAPVSLLESDILQPSRKKRDMLEDLPRIATHWTLLKTILQYSTLCQQLNP